MPLLADTYADRIVGALSCFDRVIITGSLVDIAYAEEMAKTLRISGVRLFDYTRFAAPLRDTVRANAERLGTEYGLTIDYRSIHLRPNSEKNTAEKTRPFRHAGRSTTGRCPEFFLGLRLMALLPPSSSYRSSRR
jgi:hypothetical protein